MTGPRIALIHALAHSVAPINEAMARDWPGAVRMNLLDDSLSADLAREGRGLDAAMHARFETLTAYAESTGLQRVFLAGQPLATLAIWAAQHWLLVALLGMTYGHRLLGLRVVRDDGARYPGFAKAGIRTVLLALVIPAVVWDSEGRGLHDRAAGTRLVRLSAPAK